MENLPIEVLQIAKNVNVEKRIEVQNVLNSVFNGVSKMREQLDSVVVLDENDKINMKIANTIRLGVRNVRLDAEKTFDLKRADVQAQMLSYKTEDSLWLKAKQTMQILTKEIEEQARWKEETKKRHDEEQKEIEVQKRIQRVFKYAPEISRTEIENMSNETFEIYANGIEKAYKDKIEAERLEAERIEKARIEHLKMVEAQRLENEKLKAEAEAKEKQLEQERAKAYAEKKAIEAKAEKEKADALTKFNAEKEAKEKLQAEINAKLQAEEKAKKELEAKILEEQKAAQKEAEKLAKAPIKKQLTIWVNSFELPPFATENKTCELIFDKFESFKLWAQKEVDTI
jgi:hypothetical protein